MANLHHYDSQSQLPKAKRRIMLRTHLPPMSIKPAPSQSTATNVLNPENLFPNLH